MSIPVTGISTPRAFAIVYERGMVSWYFCCETCGVCGKDWNSYDYAVVQAAEHVSNLKNHNQEEPHGYCNEDHPALGRPDSREAAACPEGQDGR